MDNEPLVLIYGASSGIGKATTLKLNSLGIKTIGIGKNLDKLEKLKKEVLYPNLLQVEARDIGKKISELSDWIEAIVKKYGRFSGYVHSAGVLNPQPVKLLSYDDVIDDFNVNLFSMLFSIKELVKKSNRQEHLNIVCVSSIAARIGNPGSVTYAMTKAAVNNMVSSIAQEIGNRNIHINAVCPGGINTPMAEYYNNNLTYDYLEKCRQKNVFHEDGKPEYIADVIHFLLSKESYWIQGQCYTVDGGESLS